MSSTGEGFDSLPRPSAPAISEEMQRLLAESKPCRGRRPHRQAVVFGGMSSAFAAASILFLGIRPDIGGLSPAYVLVLAVAWTFTVAALGYLALVPRSGSALLRWHLAGAAGIGAGFLFGAIGLLWTESVPGASISYDPSAANVLRWAPFCLGVGTGSSLVPLALAGMLLRRAVPLGSRWIGAAIGGCGGCLGGLILHLHCHIAEPTHFGLIHGGAVLLAAGIGAVVLPRLART